jgi:hypothetical protein
MLDFFKVACDVIQCRLNKSGSSKKLFNSKLQICKMEMVLVLDC